MATESLLDVLGDKTLQDSACRGFTAYAPYMELLAIGSARDKSTTPDTLRIFRLNGQQVFASGAPEGIQSIAWKPNGQLLAVANGEGFLKLLDAEGYKPVHKTRPIQNWEDVKITCIGWVSNCTKKLEGSAQDDAKSPWKDLLAKYSDDKENRALDLPRDLAAIEIESSMPKLPVLAMGSSSENLFRSRDSIDRLFSFKKPDEYDIIDVLIVGISDGSLHLTIYDSFLVGEFPSPLQTGSRTPYSLALHASHKHSSLHSLLYKSDSVLVGGLYYIPMDLRFISTDSEYIGLLASRSTALQNLLRYIDQVQISMKEVWNASQELPGRFLSFINETLAEKDGWSIEQALYHSVVTGHTYPEVKEWLIDTVGERGHKRWDKNVQAGLENLRNLVYQYMLPALERATVILSRLYGIAKYQGSNGNTGFSSQQIKAIMETITCMNLVCARILNYVVEELDLFSSFSAWLRYEIDRLASDSSNSPSDEQIEKEAVINHSKVLQYIQTCLTNSRLSAFFSTKEEEELKEVLTKQFDEAERGVSIFELLDKQLQNHELGQPYLAALPKVELIYQSLERQANAVFKLIAEGCWKRNVIFGQPVPIHQSKDWGLTDMTQCVSDASHSSTYIATQFDGKRDTVRITRIAMVTENGISTRESTSEASVSLGAESRILDIKFFFDEALFILSSKTTDSGSKDPPILHAVPFRASTSTLLYHPVTVPGNPPAAPHTAIALIEHVKSYSIPIPHDDGAWEPCSISVTRTAKPESVRIVILGRDGGRVVVCGVPGETEEIGGKKEGGESGEEEGDVSMTT